MINDNDTALFFDLNVFGEVAKLNGRTTTVIFDKVTTQFQEGYSVVSTHTPQITCQSVDVARANLDQDSTVLVRAKSYRVADIQDDGTGITVLVLREA